MYERKIPESRHYGVSLVGKPDVKWKACITDAIHAAPLLPEANRYS